MRIHIVQKGDTLWKIAQKYGVNFEELKKVNSHLTNPDLIMPGMKIKVPIQSAGKKKEVPIVSQQKKQQQHHHHHGQPSIKEQPLKQPQIKEKQVVQQKEKQVKKEKPSKPFQPVLPQLPGIDVSNYYTVNMANMSLQQAQMPKPTQEQHVQLKEPALQQAVQPQPVVPIQPLPQPTLIDQPLPKVKKEIDAEKEVVTEEKQHQPLIEYCPTCCTPITQIMPGAGFNYPLACALQQSILPYQQMLMQQALANQWQQGDQFPQFPVEGDCSTGEKVGGAEIAQEIGQGSQIMSDQLFKQHQPETIKVQGTTKKLHQDKGKEQWQQLGDPSWGNVVMPEGLQPHSQEQFLTGDANKGQQMIPAGVPQQTPVIGSGHYGMPPQMPYNWNQQTGHQPMTQSHCGHQLQSGDHQPSGIHHHGTMGGQQMWQQGGLNEFPPGMPFSGQMPMTPFGAQPSSQPHSSYYSGGQFGSNLPMPAGAHQGGIMPTGLDSCVPMMSRDDDFDDDLD